MCVKLTIKGIKDYTVPMFGNTRCMPYGKLYVTDGITTKICGIKEDEWRQYITWNRHRYYIKNVGRLYEPKFVFCNTEGV